jgi:DNA-binding CsgD family transcriptional regulator
VLEPELWSTVCHDIATSVGAHSSHLMAVDRSSGADIINFLDRQDPAAHRQYIEEFLPGDIRIPRLAAVRVGTVIRDEEVWTLEEKLESPVYHEYQRKHKLLQITGAQLGLEDKLSWYGVSREVDEPFVGEDLKVLNTLIPHIRQSLRTMFEISSLRAREKALGTVWSANGRGLVLLAPGGRVEFVNEEAKRMASRREVELSGGVLRFAEPSLNGLLAANLEALRRGQLPAAAQTAGLAMDRRGDQLGIRFHNVPSDGLPFGPASGLLAVLIIPLTAEAAAGDGEIGQFGSLFGLTPSERRVLSALVGGKELSSYARECRLSLDTVRKQLKSVLAKTGCRNQKALIRLIERFCFLRLR